MDTKHSKKKTYALIVAMGVFFVLLVLFFPRKNSIDQLPDEPTSNKYSSQVIFTNGKDLLNQAENLTTHEFVATDLYTFAKKLYPAYKKSGVSIGFKIDGTPQKNERTIRFTGRFGAIKNNISVEVVLLKKERIKISITDTKTKQNIDSELSSNSKKNQFIGMLPLEKTTFNIDYTTSTKTFLITSYDGTATTRSTAESLLLSSLGESSLKNIQYNYIVARSAGVSYFPDLD